MTQSLNNRIEFLLISGVWLPSIIQFFTKVGNGMTLLTQNTSYTVPNASHAISKPLRNLEDA